MDSEDSKQPEPLYSFNNDNGCSIRPTLDNIKDVENVLFLQQVPQDNQSKNTDKKVQIENIYTNDEQKAVIEYLRHFFQPKQKWTLQQFIEELDRFYEVTRFRYTKGGHKVNQDTKVRHTFICQCHGRGSHIRSQKHRIRTHYFSQSECRSRIAIKQCASNKDEWMLDKGDLKHNHEPQSPEFIESSRTKEITQEQRVFITRIYQENSQINGSALRKKYKELYPDQPDMFPKKVQNLLQDLRKGRTIVKDDKMNESIDMSYPLSSRNSISQIQNDQSKDYQKEKQVISKSSKPKNSQKTQPEEIKALKNEKKQIKAPKTLALDPKAQLSGKSLTHPMKKNGAAVKQKVIPEELKFDSQQIGKSSYLPKRDLKNVRKVLSKDQRFQKTQQQISEQELKSIEKPTITNSKIMKLIYAARAYTKCDQVDQDDNAAIDHRNFNDFIMLYIGTDEKILFGLEISGLSAQNRSINHYFRQQSGQQ